MNLSKADDGGRQSGEVRFPGVLLILGTDASGKNYVANVIVDIMEKSGRTIDKRDGWFYKKAATDLTSSEDKGFLDLAKEKAFISLFPFVKFTFPRLLTFLVNRDLKKFERGDDNVVVISHTALRILAFYMGHVFDREETIRLPKCLDKALKKMAPATGAMTIVLDIDDEIRKNRIRLREMDGKMDNFDHYMAKDGERSERIEHFLVWLATTYLNAVVIENNDLNNEELTAEIYKAFGN